MAPRPAFAEDVEVHDRREHRVVLDGVEQVGVPIHVAAQGAAGRKERVRRDNEAAFPLLQTRQLFEGEDRLGRAAEVEKQDVPPVNCPLDAGNKCDAARPRICLERCRIELPVVQGHRERVKAKLGRPVDQVTGAIGDPIRWIVRRMGMKLDFQHHSRHMIHKSCRRRSAES